MIERHLNFVFSNRSASLGSCTTLLRKDLCALRPSIPVPAFLCYPAAPEDWG
jgi:hypothetical protein